jgi:hypothetical protein
VGNVRSDEQTGYPLAPQLPSRLRGITLPTQPRGGHDEPCGSREPCPFRVVSRGLSLFDKLTNKHRERCVGGVHG